MYLAGQPVVWPSVTFHDLLCLPKTTGALSDVEFDCDSGISPAAYWLHTDFPIPCLECQARQGLVGSCTSSKSFKASTTRCKRYTPRAILTGCRQKASVPCSSCASPHRRCVQHCASDTALWHCDPRQLFSALSCPMAAAEMEMGPKTNSLKRA